jgi:hypothetical protein
MSTQLLHHRSPARRTSARPGSEGLSPRCNCAAYRFRLIEQKVGHHVAPITEKDRYT